MQYADFLQSSTLLAAAALTQNATNGGSMATGQGTICAWLTVVGASQLGTAEAQTYPAFLTNNTDRTPFVRNGVVLTAATNNPYNESLPDTGTIRPYDFTIARHIIAPDGQETPCILINGAFPGPTIEANYGDTFEITVHNNITDPPEGTSLHWHGLLQKDTQWYDGVPSVGQCPIAPGSDFTYTFRASLYGTSWYHSHFSAQYAVGLFGPMIIHGPNLTEEAVYDVDLGPVVLTDWYHTNISDFDTKNSYLAIVEEQETNDPLPTGIPVPDNNLINGKMFFDCPSTPDPPYPEPTQASASLLTCNQDNKLRALERFSTQASTFCPTYLATTTNAPLPTYVSAFQSADVSSACSCFEASATITDVVLTLSPTPTPTPTSTSTVELKCTPNAPISNFNFTSGKTHRLRLINAGAEALQRFTIDDHEMTVIANDFVPIKPYNTNVVTLGAGQRTDILVTANGSSTDSVFMRSNISEKCTGAPNALALAAIFYENADRNATPPDNPQSYDDSKCGNDDLNLTVPLYDYDPIPPPSTTQIIEIEFHNNGTDIQPDTGYGTNGSLQWFMNNSTFHANYDHPLLNLTYNGNTSYPDDPQWNVYNFGQNTSVRLILRNHVPAEHAAHPMHLHGHNFVVLAEGYGDYDGTIINPQNPQRRDTQMMTQANKYTGEPSYMVIQFDMDNPGVWPLHCHRAWHVSSGLYVNIMERPDEIKQSVIPGIIDQTCAAWYAYDHNIVVDQIDSGL